MRRRGRGWRWHYPYAHDQKHETKEGVSFIGRPALLARRFLEAGEGVLQRLHFRERQQESERRFRAVDLS